MPLYVITLERTVTTVETTNAAVDADTVDQAKQKLVTGDWKPLEENWVFKENQEPSKFYIPIDSEVTQIMHPNYVKTYLMNTKGKQCPACSMPSKLHFDGPNEEGVADVKCADCGAKWKAVYSITAISDITINSKG